MDLGRGLGHLTYSTLVHPADDWPQLWDSLQRYLPQVKQRVSPKADFGVRKWLMRRRERPPGPQGGFRASVAELHLISKAIKFL